MREVHLSIRTRLPALPLLFTAACVAHRQVQYFEVVEPGTGHVNYYRMTVEGRGAAGAAYQMQAGYLSAASVDVLRGQLPAMPEVDLPIEHDGAYDALVAGYYRSLLEAADALPPTREITPTGRADPDSPRTAAARRDLDAHFLARARLVWFGQLSPADVASMGMHGAANPFQFRKLVFWTAARSIDLRQFGAEVDAAVASAVTLVRARKAESRERSRRIAALRRLAQDMMQQNATLAPYAGVIDLLLPSTEPQPAPDPAGPSAHGSGR